MWGFVCNHFADKKRDLPIQLRTHYPAVLEILRVARTIAMSGYIRDYNHELEIFSDIVGKASSRLWMEIHKNQGCWPRCGHCTASTLEDSPCAHDVLNKYI